MKADVHKTIKFFPHSYATPDSVSPADLLKKTACEDLNTELVIGYSTSGQALLFHLSTSTQ